MPIRAFSVAMFLLVASAITPAFSAPIEYAVGTCNLAIFTDLFVAFGTLNWKTRITAEARDSKVKSLASARWRHRRGGAVKLRKTLSEPIYLRYFSDSKYGDLLDVCTET